MKLRSGYWMSGEDHVDHRALRQDHAASPSIRAGTYIYIIVWGLMAGDTLGGRTRNILVPRRPVVGGLTPILGSLLLQVSAPQGI